jgi:hypothetical protein
MLKMAEKTWGIILVVINLLIVVFALSLLGCSPKKDTTIKTIPTHKPSEPANNDTNKPPTEPNTEPTNTPTIPPSNRIVIWDLWQVTTQREFNNQGEGVAANAPCRNSPIIKNSFTLCKEDGTCEVYEGKGIELTLIDDYIVNVKLDFRYHKNISGNCIVHYKNAEFKMIPPLKYSEDIDSELLSELYSKQMNEQYVFEILKDGDKEIAVTMHNNNEWLVTCTFRLRGKK